MALGHLLRNAARRYGDETALITDSRSLSFNELDGMSDAVAFELIEAGIRQGDRVSLFSENRWEWVVAYHAAMKAGAVVNPINVMLTPSEIQYMLIDCGPSVLFGSEARLEGLAEVQAPSLQRIVCFDGPTRAHADFTSWLGKDRPEFDIVDVEPTSASTIGYTSGTTGHPKGAVQSNRAVELNCGYTATMHSRNTDDVVLTGLPLSHVYGNVVVNGTLMAGGTVRLMERFAPDRALQLITRHRVTMFEGVPTMYAMMLSHEDVKDADLSTLTRCTVGGQTMAVSAMQEWEARSGAPLIELWGMTELAGLGTTHTLHTPNVHGSIGVALPGTDVRIADYEDITVTMPPNELGEVVVGGPLVMEGYWGNQEASDEVLHDGWLRTGDVGYASDDGHFFVVDRRKDMILTGGYNIYPAEIERVVSGHPAVAMVAVGRVPDELKGELARAYVVLRPGATVTEEELLQVCRKELAAYKVPRSVAFVQELPLTASGKTMRRKLAELDSTPPTTRGP